MLKENMLVCFTEEAFRLLPILPNIAKHGVFTIVLIEEVPRDSKDLRAGFLTIATLCSGHFCNVAWLKPVIAEPSNESILKPK